VLRGLEIYKGKPIFYSLANFIMHVPGSTVPAGSYEAWGLPKDTLDESQFEAKIPYGEQPRFWRSVVPKITMEGGTSLTGGPGRVTAIELHPITLGYKQPIWRHGTPELAEGKEAKEILDSMASLSKPFGTQIRIEGNVGKVVLHG
jgi:poly-gamma-glutamate synthesis protein (capsule biosynthesis protein)